MRGPLAREGESKPIFGLTEDGSRRGPLARGGESKPSGGFRKCCIRGAVYRMYHDGTADRISTAYNCSSIFCELADSCARTLRECAP